MLDIKIRAAKLSGLKECDRLCKTPELSWANNEYYSFNKLKSYLDKKYFFNS